MHFLIALLAIACFIVVGLLTFAIRLLVDMARKRRLLRDLRIRDEQLRRYNMAAFTGTKDRFL
jgi:hypothetical protein